MSAAVEARSIFTLKRMLRVVHRGMLSHDEVSAREVTNIFLALLASHVIRSMTLFVGKSTLESDVCHV